MLCRCGATRTSQGFPLGKTMGPARKLGKASDRRLEGNHQGPVPVEGFGSAEVMVGRNIPLGTEPAMAHDQLF